MNLNCKLNGLIDDTRSTSSARNTHRALTDWAIMSSLACVAEDVEIEITIEAH